MNFYTEPKGKQETSRIIKRVTRARSYSLMQVAAFVGTQLTLISNCDIALPGIDCF